ncbi:MAG: putative rane-bound dehydrogenase [Planctomycetota bacterium]|nr:putative rane-bound dehydrogenase [Planctomycetota bacterium]
MMSERLSARLILLLAPCMVAADEPKGQSVTPHANTAPVASSESARRMTLPEGFTATLFAAEPDVHQPIAFTIDARGRLWVVENYSYPIWLGGPQGRDRILIFEDTDGDGKHDKRTVFWDKGNNVTGIALGFGGVYVCATPNMLFIPDKNGDDVPDGEPVIKLDGWDTKAQHNMFNALTWGPDGWLWGCNGILSNSRVGKPGTPDHKRVPINCGVWRYHPTREVFEVVATGTTNPWGLDFDSHGEAFITNCVIPHLFRVTPGAHYQRMFGQDFNPHLYGLMESCADHVHWDTVQIWSDIRKLGVTPTTDRAGGGHAHAGAMIYLGDNWPDRYRDTLFTCNIHGHRVNNDILERKGSGYVAKHAKDFLLANDDWFRGLEMKYGPDGAAYLTDWSDTGECHENDADNAHRENGRIYKISFGNPKPVKVDLAQLSDEELVRLQIHKNDWYARTARRLLQERAAAGKSMEAVHTGLRAIFGSDDEVSHKLRALWTLHATGGLSPKSGPELLAHKNEYVRSWAVRLLVDEKSPDPEALRIFQTMAAVDPSPLVRLSLASALQHLPMVGHPPADTARWNIASSLAEHAEDANDASLPFMVWYGMEPLVVSDRSRAARLMTTFKIPILRRYLARRIVLADEELARPGMGQGSFGLDQLTSQLADRADPEYRRDVLAGMLDAFRGRKRVAAPQGWAKAAAVLEKSTDAEVRLRATLLSLVFGDPKAGETLQAIVADKAAPEETRRAALQAVVEAKIPGLAPKLRAMLDDRTLRGPVLRALATVPDEGTPKVITDHYRELSPAEREDAINTLASRADFAMSLLDAIASGTIPPRDLSVTTARQLQALGKPLITERLEKLWGSSRPTSKEKVALMARYKTLVAPESGKAADPSRGRLVFNRTCLQCHKLYDGGGDVGPNLTGSDRASIDYILENVLDPSATVAREYRLTTTALHDGRVISGIIREQNDKTVTIQTVNERIVLPREEIEAFTESPVSMMPEGLLEKLTSEELRDLIAYLASKSQVPASGPAQGR